MFVRLFRLCSWRLFVFIAICYAVMWLYHNWFAHSAVDLPFFLQFSLLWKLLLWHSHTRFSARVYISLPMSGISGARSSCLFLASLILPNSFPKLVVPVDTPTDRVWKFQLRHILIVSFQLSWWVCSAASLWFSLFFKHFNYGKFQIYVKLEKMIG